MSQSDEFSSKANIFVSPVVDNTKSVVIASANQKRLGIILWNDPAYSVFIAFGPACDTTSLVTLEIKPSSWLLIPGPPVYTGIISGRRKSGTGVISVTEILRE